MTIKYEKGVSVRSDQGNIEGVRYRRPALSVEPLRAGLRRFLRPMSGESKEISKGEKVEEGESSHIEPNLIAMLAELQLGNPRQSQQVSGHAHEPGMPVDPRTPALNSIPATQFSHPYGNVTSMTDSPQYPMLSSDGMHHGFYGPMYHGHMPGQNPIVTGEMDLGGQPPYGTEQSVYDQTQTYLTGEYDHTTVGLPAKSHAGLNYQNAMAMYQYGHLGILPGHNWGDGIEQGLYLGSMYPTQLTKPNRMNKMQWRGRAAQKRSMTRLPLDCEDFDSKHQQFEQYVQHCNVLDARNKSLLQTERISGRPSTYQLTILKSAIDSTQFSAQLVSRVPIIYLLECSMEYEGSKAIQKVLDDRKDEDDIVRAIHQALMPYIIELSSDTFGNYIVQKLLAHGKQDIKEQICSAIHDKIFPLSLHKFGCRVVQCAINNSSHEERELLATDFEPFTLHCIQSPNANHVIQAFMRLESEQKPEILEQMHATICKHAILLAKHEYGCRVLISALESDINADESLRIVRSLESEYIDLSQHEHANFVVQYLVESDAYEARDRVISCVLHSSICSLSCHKYASNLIEKSLIHGSVLQREKLIEAILQDCQSYGDGPIDLALATFATDKYANYVVKSAIQAAAPMEKQLLASYLRDHINLLSSSPYGRHLAFFLSN
eukprot:jgi/Picsp_1/1678/NSC_05152-R1_pumilio homolog 2